MSEEVFDGLLITILDTHREAAVKRRRIRYLIAVFAAVFVAASYLTH
jgi:hypothetical protein